VYLDSNEYVTARAEMETLKQKDDESVEHFLMRFRNINNRMGRSEKDKAVMYDFYGRIRSTVRRHLVAGKDFKTFRELYEAVSLVKQDQKMSKATHSTSAKQQRTLNMTSSSTTAAARNHNAISSSRIVSSAPRNSPNTLAAGEKAYVKKIESPEERERLSPRGQVSPLSSYGMPWSLWQPEVLHYVLRGSPLSKPRSKEHTSPK
jgi:hypothetical protein